MPLFKVLFSSLSLNVRFWRSRDDGKYGIEQVERSLYVKSESNSSFLSVTFYQLYVIFSVNKSKVNTILSYKLVLFTRYTLFDIPLWYIVTFEVYFVTCKVCVGSVEIPYHKNRLPTSYMYLNLKIQGLGTSNHLKIDCQTQTSSISDLWRLLG